MGDVLHSILNLSSPWAYLIIGTLVALEASAFIGLFVPGEIAMLYGGVLVFEGAAELSWMIFAGALGAIIGDSIGYEIGRRFGRSLEASRLGRWVGQERWERSRVYIRKRGGRAVFLGRFVGVLRALVPAVAGDAGIRYRTFLFFNVAGGVTWVVAFVLLGAAAGGSYRAVEEYAGRASLVLAGLLVTAVVIGMVARWVQNNQQGFIARRDRFLERPRITRIRERFGSQITFVGRRLDPGERFGLFVTVGIVIAIAGGWAFGAILQDVLGRDELALFDEPIDRWIVDHRDPTLTAAMKAVTFLGSQVFVITVLVVASSVVYARTRNRRWPMFLAASLFGGLLLSSMFKFLIARQRPTLAPLVVERTPAFPSGHTIAATVLFGCLAYILTRDRGWRTTIVVWSLAGFAALVVGFSRIYLGVHWTTDVLGGLALGSFWVAVTITATSMLIKR